MAIIPAACAYHPVRTVAISDSVEFEEAAARLHYWRSRKGGRAEFLGILDALADDVMSDIKNLAKKGNPPWDADEMSQNFQGHHNFWVEAGQKIWDVSFVIPELSRSIQDFSTIRIDKIMPDELLVYVHFGAEGPPSPWEGIRIEGCYVNNGWHDAGTVCTFVLSHPEELPLQHSPVALSLAAHLRHYKMFLEGGSPLTGELNRELRRLEAQDPVWTPCIPEALALLASSLAFISNSGDRKELGYPSEAPRHLVAKTELGGELETLKASGHLASLGFIPVNFYGRRSVLKGMDEALGGAAS